MQGLTNSISAPSMQRICICMCRSHQSIAELLGRSSHELGKNTDTEIVGDRWTGGGGHHALYSVLLTGEKKSDLGCLISFELPMGFQNFVVINKIHNKKTNNSIGLPSIQVLTNGIGLPSM